MIDWREPTILGGILAAIVAILLKVADLASAARVRRDAALDRAVRLQLEAETKAKAEDDRRIAAEARADTERDKRRDAEATLETRDREVARLERATSLLEAKNGELETASRLGGRLAREIGRWRMQLTARERVADERAIESGHLACEAEAARLGRVIAEREERIYDLRERLQGQGRQTTESLPLSQEELGGGDD